MKKSKRIIFFVAIAGCLLVTGCCAAIKYNSSDPKDIFGVEIASLGERISDMLSVTHFGRMYSSFRTGYTPKRKCNKTPAELRALIEKKVPEFQSLLCLVSSANEKCEKHKFEDFEMIIQEYIFVTANYWLRLGFQGRNILLRNIRDAFEISVGGGAFVPKSAYPGFDYQLRELSRMQYNNSVKKHSLKYQRRVGELVASQIFDLGTYLEEAVGGPVLNLDQIKTRISRLNKIIEKGAPSGFFARGKVSELWADLEKDMGYLSWQSALLYRLAAEKDLAKAREARKRAAEEFLNR